MSSARTAIWLLSISAVVILAGTLIEQNQSPDKYIQTYGPTFFHLIQALHLFDLYHSAWFEILMALICVNLILSNLNRAKKILKQYYHPPLAMGSNYFEHEPVKRLLQAHQTVQQTCDKLEKALQKLGYRIQKQSAPDALYLYAHRGLLALWGSFVAHFGLLILFAGVLYGHLPGQGFQRDMVLMEKGSDYIREGPFWLSLQKFDVEWDEHRRPLLFRSTLEVTDENGKKFSKAVLVNHPLNYRGIKVYQAKYAPGRILGHYVDLSGRTHPFSVDYNQRGIAFFSIAPGNGKHWVGMIRDFIPDLAVGPKGEIGSRSSQPANLAYHLSVVTKTDKMPPSPQSIHSVGWISKNRAAAFGGISFSLDQVLFLSGFELRKDPGVPFIYGSFITIFLGVCLTFYLHHKVLRAKVTPTQEGTQTVIVGARTDKEQDYTREFDAMAEGLREG